MPLTLWVLDRLFASEPDAMGTTIRSAAGHAGARIGTGRAIRLEPESHPECAAELPPQIVCVWLESNLMHAQVEPFMVPEQPRDRCRCLPLSKGDATVTSRGEMACRHDAMPQDQLGHGV